MTGGASTDPAWTRGFRLILLLVGMTLLVRAQTFGNPVIEFDEQFYRLVGERMLHGALPFVDIWDRKPLGLFLLYAGAALIGGDHPLPYQLLASACVVATAWLIHAMARRLCTSWRGPLLAAAFYILWLNLLQGEGGQASVLYMPLMCAAALLVMRHAIREAPGQALLRDGALAMLLIGLAAQIKYTVLLEGMFFGIGLLLVGWREAIGWRRLALFALCWMSLAVVPTLAAWGYYAHLGHGDAWVFANVTSITRRATLRIGTTLGDFAVGMGILLPLTAPALFAIRRLSSRPPAMRFVLAWAVMAFLAILLLMSFGPHYWIPLVPSLAVLAAPAFEASRRLAWAVALLAIVAGQGLVAFYIYSKGDGQTMRRMVRAIGPVPRCLYVFDGFPALYSGAESCLPTRFVFPGHLNMSAETEALGVDPAVEVARILAGKPDAIVTDEPYWEYGNPQTRALVDQAIATHYRLVLREPTGKGRWRRVYRRIDAQGDARR